MRRVSIAALAVYGLLLAILCWRIITFDVVPWLKVETPDSVYTGASFLVRVTLREPADGLILRVDLHWLDGDRKPRGYHSSGKPQPVIDGTRTYDFLCPVRDAPEAAYVFPVVYLTADGSWAARTRVADASSAPIVRGADAPETAKLRRVGLSDNARKPPAGVPEARPLRWLVAGVWFAAAVLGFSGAASARTRLLAAAAVAAGAWELFAASDFMARALRAVAWWQGWYLKRRGPQGLLTLAAVLALLAAGIVPVILSHSLKRTLAWLSMLTFWGVSALRIVSFHELDAILAQPALGMQTGQLARLAAAVLCLLLVPPRKGARGGRPGQVGPGRAGDRAGRGRAGAR